MGLPFRLRILTDVPKKAQVAIPSEENVIRAKEWVDYNIK